MERCAAIQFTARGIPYVRFQRMRGNSKGRRVTMVEAHNHQSLMYSFPTLMSLFIRWGTSVAYTGTFKPFHRRLPIFFSAYFLTVPVAQLDSSCRDLLPSVAMLMCCGDERKNSWSNGRNWSVIMQRRREVVFLSLCCAYFSFNV